MTGGMAERVVGQNNVDYSTFSSQNHGDGNLTSEAYSNVVGWTENMIGSRGFSWNNEWNGFTISNRAWNHHNRPSLGNDNQADWAGFGGRGVRSN